MGGQGTALLAGACHATLSSTEEADALKSAVTVLVMCRKEGGFADTSAHVVVPHSPSSSCLGHRSCVFAAHASVVQYQGVPEHPCAPRSITHTNTYTQTHHAQQHPRRQM